MKKNKLNIIMNKKFDKKYTKRKKKIYIYIKIV